MCGLVAWLIALLGRGASRVATLTPPRSAFPLHVLRLTTRLIRWLATVGLLGNFFLLECPCLTSLGSTPLSLAGRFLLLASAIVRPRLARCLLAGASPFALPGLIFARPVAVLATCTAGRLLILSYRGGYIRLGRRIFARPIAVLTRLTLLGCARTSFALLATRRVGR